MNIDEIIYFMDKCSLQFKVHFPIFRFQIKPV